MNGQVCSAHLDCASDFCVPELLLCAEMTCSDGYHNQNETDLDCGGVCGASCANGQVCAAHADCVSEFCMPDLLLCAEMTCSDGYINQNETDLDCGGICGATCANNLKCKVHEDCMSNFCTPDSLVCIEMTCNDGYLNLNETDVDCGGVCGATCEYNEDCLTNSDCAEDFCFKSKCAPSVPTVILSVSAAAIFAINSLVVLIWIFIL